LPRYFIENFLGKEEIGYFASVAYLLVIFNLFANSISQYFLPGLSNLIKAGKYKQFQRYLFLKMNISTLLIGITLLIIFAIFGEYILLLVYGEEYTHLKNLMILIGIATIFNTISWNY